MSDEQTKFVKLFEVDGEQVLFFLEPDSDQDEREKLNQIVRVDGTYMNIGIAGLTYEKADEALANLDEARARELLIAARAMLQGDPS